MKKIILIICVLLSTFFVSSCAQKTATADAATPAINSAATAPQHHDYKGEVK